MKKNHVLILYMAFFVAALLQCTVKFNIQTEIFILVYRSSANGKKRVASDFFSDITKVIINTQRFLYSFQHFPQPHAGPSSRPFSSQFFPLLPFHILPSQLLSSLQPEWEKDVFMLLRDWIQVRKGSQKESKEAVK